MTSFDQASLASAAGVNPWDLLTKLKSGDPAQIESLAAAFYKAGGDMSDAHAASSQAQAYVKQGYKVQGSSPLDFDKDAAQTKAAIKGGADNLPKIAKILGTVASDLAGATKKAAGEVDTLDGQLNKIVNEWNTFWQGVGHHLPEEDWMPVRQGYLDQAVAAVKTHGQTVNGYLTDYEATLAGSLRSMADLGYIPPDPVDEGPGDINPTAGDGAKDAQTTIDAINDKDHKKGIQLYNQSTELVDLLNRQMKANGRISDAEYTYLWQYYNTLAPSLPKLDTWLHDPATLKAETDLDHLSNSAPDQRQAAAALKQRGSIVADGLLNLSKAAEQPTDNGTAPDTYGPGGEQLGRGGVSGLPPSVQKFLYLDLGQQVANDPNIAQDPNHPGSTLRATWDPKTHQWVIANEDQAGGFSDLLSNYSSDNVTGGVGFSKAMGEAGIRWKQELNTIHDNTKAYYEAELEHYAGSDTQRWVMARDFARDGDLGEAQKLMSGLMPDGMPDMPYWDDKSFNADDTLASNALTVAAHNSTGSAELLLNADDRHALMGLNWQHGHGAALALVSGTRPSADDSAVTNQAAAAVMKDGAANYNHPGAITSHDVEDALTTVAVQHIDTFASSGNMTPGMHDVTLPDGSVIHVVGLNSGDAENYLKLISSFGDKNYALVQQAGLERGSQYIASAIKAGVPHDSHQYETVWQMAGQLDGHISGAGMAQMFDQYRGDAQHTQQQLVDAHEVYRNQLASYNAIANPLKWVSSAVSLGGNIAGVVPGGQAVGAGLGFASTGLGMVSNMINAPDNPMDDPKWMEKAYQLIGQGATLDQEAVGGFGQRSDAALWMAARAQQIADPGVAGPAYGPHGEIQLATGSGGDQGPAHTVQLSDSDKVSLEETVYPHDPGTDGGSQIGQNAYSDWVRDHAAPTGHSWTDADPAWRVHYGYNQRVNWGYGYNSVQQDEQHRGIAADPAQHPLLKDEGPDNDPKTKTPGPGDVRTSAYDQH